MLFLFLYLPRADGGLSGLRAPPPALFALPALVGVTDFEIGVVGFSSIFLVDGVLAFDDVPLRGLDEQWKNKLKGIKTFEQYDLYNLNQSGSKINCQITCVVLHVPSLVLVYQFHSLEVMWFHLGVIQGPVTKN